MLHWDTKGKQVKSLLHAQVQQLDEEVRHTKKESSQELEDAKSTHWKEKKWLSAGINEKKEAISQLRAKHHEETTGQSSIINGLLD